MGWPVETHQSHLLVVTFNVAFIMEHFIKNKLGPDITHIITDIICGSFTGLLLKLLVHKSFEDFPKKKKSYSFSHNCSVSIPNSVNVIN